MTKQRKHRKKSPTPAALETVRDVDRALLEIAEAEAEAERAKTDAEEKIRQIREKAAARAAEVLDRAKALRKAVESWAKANKKTFGQARSRAFPHGRVGWRRVTSLAFKAKADEIAERLEARGLEDAVTITKRVNRDVLATFDDEVLQDLGVRRQTKNRFYIEPAAETPPASE